MPREESLSSSESLGRSRLDFLHGKFAPLSHENCGCHKFSFQMSVCSLPVNLSLRFYVEIQWSMFLNLLEQNFSGVISGTSLISSNVMAGTVWSIWPFDDDWRTTLKFSPVWEGWGFAKKSSGEKVLGFLILSLGQN